MGDDNNDLRDIDSAALVGTGLTVLFAGAILAGNNVGSVPLLLVGFSELPASGLLGLLLGIGTFFKKPSGVMPMWPGLLAVVLSPIAVAIGVIGALFALASVPVEPF